ncbi:MAG: helix-turn-helix transcriptional regulator [Burkholderiales bacterium PBB6]|nr:MAG: helix-turn-helix transcriptional regulator [Burkholderiales bacterium PBB6]
MHPDTATLRSFSQSLLTLAEVARRAPPDRLMNDALMALRQLVPFRSAWWGECSDSGTPLPRKNWLHGRINLSASFAREWNELADDDVFASDSMRELGTVIRASGHDDLPPDVEAFSRRHALDHAMAITLEMPDSGMMFFVSLYRSEAEPAFDDDEAERFAQFTMHLLQHWRFRVQDLLLDASSGASDGFALADTRGGLLYLGARLGQVLHGRYPEWVDSPLPLEVSAMLAKAPCALALGPERLTLQPCGELVVIALDRGGRSSMLPPRERSAAMLYAQGHSYKEIARLLQLSPATVRTYLRSVYLHLGVRNKVELLGALGHGT